MSSGYVPPAPSMRPGEVEIVRQLKMLVAMVQVLCAMLAILGLVLGGWLLGIWPDFVSPLVEVRL